ncbi:MAG: peptide chain release factor N(5)-glutamine methyltransferase [Halothiobacillaceae bacterium]
MNIAQALQHARRLLGGDEAAVDARHLLGACCGLDHAGLILQEDRTLTPQEQSRFEDWLERRSRGVPVAYLVGRRGFRNLSLAVNPSTLIPRPDTETLVEAALALGAPDRPLRVLDLGTGSGAIALSIAAERPAWTVVATDRSAEALDVARQNAAALGLDRVRFLEGDWFQALGIQAPFDLILSNPPYVAADDPHLLQGDLRHEPRSALVSGADGLDDLARLCAGAPRWLLPGGWLLLEHGWAQGAAVRDLLCGAGFRSVATRQDLAGHERVGMGRYDPPAESAAVTENQQN